MTKTKATYSEGCPGGNRDRDLHNWIKDSEGPSSRDRGYCVWVDPSMSFDTDQFMLITTPAGELPVKTHEWTSNEMKGIHTIAQLCTLTSTFGDQRESQRWGDEICNTSGGNE